LNRLTDKICAALHGSPWSVAPTRFTTRRELPLLLEPRSGRGSNVYSLRIENSCDPLDFFFFTNLPKKSPCLSFFDY